MSTTKEILDHHWDAFTTQDLEMVMEDYTDDSVVITNLGTFHGLDEIEGLFTNIFDEFSQPGSTAELEMEEIEGDTAYIVWHGETPDNEYTFATDTFRIEDGIITVQTFGGMIEEK
jgi:ketosteroid isomerase-like protein